MRTVVIVVVLPLLELLVEEVDVLADAVTIEELIELLVVDSVRTLDFAIQTRCARLDVDVANVLALQMPVKR
jgi:hypothetical protein